MSSTNKEMQWENSHIWHPTHFRSFEIWKRFCLDSLEVLIRQLLETQNCFFVNMFK